jgi:hypothetical protein
MFSMGLKNLECLACIVDRLNLETDFQFTKALIPERSKPA